MDTCSTRTQTDGKTFIHQRRPETPCIDVDIVLFARHRRQVGSSSVVCLRKKSVFNAHKRNEKLIPSSGSLPHPDIDD